ncbi:MAG TPA: photosynthetic complex assembly protein PuhC [Steroidobacteraceae bacterium]|nr:photosynthetic complex assembly protein PuhC [Steroidobacteraceae bacterium]
MSNPFENRGFPRGVLIATGVLIAVSITAVSIGRYAEVGTTRVPEARLVELRDVHFADRDDGAVVVHTDDRAAPIAVLAPGTNGFARGVLRGLARERRRSDIGMEPAFQLARWSDGRLTLEDPTTGRSIELGAFGPTNAGVFAELLTAAVADGA